MPLIVPRRVEWKPLTSTSHPVLWIGRKACPAQGYRRKCLFQRNNSHDDCLGLQCSWFCQCIESWFLIAPLMSLSYWEEAGDGVDVVVVVVMKGGSDGGRPGGI